MNTQWFRFFNDTATTEIYTLSLHDALPILANRELQIPAHGPENDLGREAEAAERPGSAHGSCSQIGKGALLLPVQSPPLNATDPDERCRQLARLGRAAGDSAAGQVIKRAGGRAGREAIAVAAVGAMRRKR